MKQIIAIKNRSADYVEFYDNFTCCVVGVQRRTWYNWATSNGYVMYLDAQIWKRSNTTMGEFNQLRAAYQFDKELEELLNDK